MLLVLELAYIAICVVLFAFSFKAVVQELVAWSAEAEEDGAIQYGQGRNKS